MNITVQATPVHHRSASVFLNRRRIFKSERVEVEGSTITVLRNRSVARIWEIVEVVKDGMAWDVRLPDGRMGRVVVQTGCGCAGMRRYTPDESYSGALSESGEHD